MVPEQRVLRFARIGPEQVAGVAATDQEIAAYYKANQATYGAKEIRDLSQAVVPDQQRRRRHRRARPRRGELRRRGRARPASSAADVAVGPQTRAEFAGARRRRGRRGRLRGASRARSSGRSSRTSAGTWSRSNRSSREGGKTLAAARAEIAAKLTADKRKDALDGPRHQVEDAIDDGSNFAEAAAPAKLRSARRR